MLDEAVVLEEVVALDVVATELVAVALEDELPWDVVVVELVRFGVLEVTAEDEDEPPPQLVSTSPEASRQRDRSFKALGLFMKNLLLIFPRS